MTAANSRCMHEQVTTRFLLVVGVWTSVFLSVGTAGAQTPGTLQAPSPTSIRLLDPSLALRLDTALLTGATAPDLRGHEVELLPAAHVEPMPSQRIDVDKEVRRVQRSRNLLKAGVPLTVLGIIGLAAAGPRRSEACYDGSRGMMGTTALSAAFLAMGTGLDIGGIVGLARASKEARASKKSGKINRRGALVALGVSLFGGVALAGVTIGNVVSCYSS